MSRKIHSHTQRPYYTPLTYNYIDKTPIPQYWRNEPQSNLEFKLNYPSQIEMHKFF